MAGTRGVDPSAALAEIRRVQARVRVHGRWPAWLWLAAGVATAGFAIFAPPVTGGGVGWFVSLGFVGVGLAALGWACRQRVMSRVAAALEYPVTGAFASLVVLDSAFRLVTRPTTLSPWVVVLGALPALPCLYAAWRAWRE